MYTIRKVSTHKYEVTSFEKYSEGECYEVTHRNNTTYCDCIGFRRQKNKEEHKHCRIVKFWINNLESEPGYCFWLDGDDIEYNKFIDTSYLKRTLENASLYL